MPSFQNLHMRVTLPSLSPLVDNVNMDFSYFGSSSIATISDVQSVVTQWVSKWTAIPTGGTAAISSYIATVIDNGTNHGTIDVYDVTGHLDGSPAGSPVLISSFTAAHGGGNPTLPEGVCCCITLQAPYGTDVEFAPGQRPRARDRGRIYLGPLQQPVVANDANQRAAFTSTFMTNVVAWLRSINVITSSPNTIPYNLCVWSRKNAAMKSLQECWVDDRPDYQRRRTDQGSLRTVQGLP